jgi:hypothetical protein
MSQRQPWKCTLRLAVDGTDEPCPGERCAFWEPGGAVLEGGCVIDRLGGDVRGPAVAAYLLELRQCVERGRDSSEAEAAHAELARRIGLEL